MQIKKWFNKISKKTRINKEISILDEISFMKKLNFFEKKMFAELFIERTFKTGELVFKEGFPHAVLYIIKSGKIEVFLDKDNNELSIATLTPGHFFGEVSLFVDSKRTASVRAIEHSVLWAISKNEFYDFIHKNPRIGVKLLYGLGENLSKSLLETNQKLKDYENRKN